jgi:acyl carrier protein
LSEKYGILIEDSEIPCLLTVNDLFQLARERAA